MASVYQVELSNADGEEIDAELILFEDEQRTQDEIVEVCKRRRIRGFVYSDDCLLAVVGSDGSWNQALNTGRQS